MARRVLQYFDWDDQGSSTFYTPGHVDGGSFDNEAAIEWETGMGGIATVAYGMVAPSGSVTFRPTATTFLAKCLRATWSSALSPLIIRCGTPSEAYHHDYAYCNTLSLTGSVNARLSATMSWMAITPDTIAVPGSWTAHHSGNPFAWHQGVTTVNNAALNMQDFTLEINNNLQAHSSLDSKASGSQRLAEEITAHNETVTLSCTVQIPPASANYMENWGDAASVAQSASLAFTSATPTTLTIALANLGLNNWKMNYVKSDGVVSWTLDFVGQTNVANTVSIS